MKPTFVAVYTKKTDLEVGDQAQQVSNYIEAHPETREPTERAKRHFANVIRKLDNPSHEVGIPPGWTITNVSEYRGAFARAVIEGQLESERKNNYVSLASMIGISEGSITTTLARADIVNRTRSLKIVRRSKAFNLRKAGVSYADIGSALSVSASKAYKDVRTILQRIAW